MLKDKGSELYQLTDGFKFSTLPIDLGQETTNLLNKEGGSPESTRIIQISYPAA